METGRLRTWRCGALGGVEHFCFISREVARAFREVTEMPVNDAQVTVCACLVAYEAAAGLG